MKKTKTRRIVSLLFISALLLPVIAVLGLTPAKVAAQPLDQVNRTIIIDMSHGQYEAGVFETDDARFAGNLTALGYESVFAWGGLNASILASARGLMLGSINHEAASGVTPFTQAEIDAVGAWFNAGHKFIWVGAD